MTPQKKRERELDAAYQLGKRDGRILLQQELRDLLNAAQGDK